MAGTTHNTNSGGIGFILTIVFIVLKLTGFIAWSWVWVLAPLWIEFILGVVILVLVLILAVLAESR